MVHLLLLARLLGEGGAVRKLDLNLGSQQHPLNTALPTIKHKLLGHKRIVKANLLLKQQRERYVCELRIIFLALDSQERQQEGD